jgi:hypothetical protein
MLLLRKLRATAENYGLMRGAGLETRPGRGGLGAMCKNHG